MAILETKLRSEHFRRQRRRMLSSAWLGRSTHDALSRSLKPTAYTHAQPFIENDPPRTLSQTRVKPHAPRTPVNTIASFLSRGGLEPIPWRTRANPPQ